MNAAALMLCWALTGQGQLVPVQQDTPRRQSPSELDPLSSRPNHPAPLDEPREFGGRGANATPSIAPRGNDLRGSDLRGSDLHTEPAARELRGNEVLPAQNTRELGREPAAPLRGAATALSNQIPETDVIAQALVPPKDSKLTGKPLALVDVMTRAANRNQRLDITRAYWKLALASADYYFAIDEEARLEQVFLEQTDYLGDAILTAERNAARAFIDETLVAAQAAQQELADLVKLAPRDPLPLTVDLPFVGPYRTQFEALFANRTAPNRIRIIDQSLPGIHSAIEKRAYAVQHILAAVGAAQQSLKRTSDASGTGAGLLITCYRELRRQRAAFIGDVRNYNNQIAEYAFGVADPNLSEDVVVGMLIRTKTTSDASRDARPAPPVTRTTFAPEPKKVVPTSASIPDTSAPSPPPQRLNANQLPSVMKRTVAEPPRLVDVPLAAAPLAAPSDQDRDGWRNLPAAAPPKGPPAR